MIAIFLVFIGALLRLVPHMPNFAPITAIGLFSGVYLGKNTSSRKSKILILLVPIAALALSDYLLLYINPYHGADFSRVHPLTSMFHSTTAFTWGSFLVSALIGLYLKTRKTPVLILGGALIASIQFFIITNFGVWAVGMYSRGLDGLLQSYIMAIPFFKWTFLGDIFYTTLFFGGYELVLLIKRKLLRSRFLFNSRS